MKINPYVLYVFGHLRQKIELSASKPEYLITERGIGYRFEAPIQNDESKES